MPLNDITILVVDDEPNVADVTARMLKGRFPFAQVLMSTSAEQAMRVLQDGRVGLLLCDLWMPVYDGTILLREAHARNPNTVSILVTGHATKESLIQALNEGHVWKVVEKPWVADDLFRWVDEGLRLYGARLSDPRAAPVIPAAEGEDPLFAKLSMPAPAAGSRNIIFRSVPEAGAPPIPAAIAEEDDEYLFVKPESFHAPVRPPKQIVIRRGLAPPPAHATTAAAGSMPDGMPPVGRRYADLELISKGGLAAVYRARDTLLGIPVAIKVVSERHAQNKKVMDLLFAEARVVMQLSHKHIVRLHNIEESQGCFYLVMEYIDGSTLRRVLKKMKALTPQMALRTVEICEDALGYAHRHGVLHRDLKPDNLMLSKDGLLKIIDFGLAHLAGSMELPGDVRGTPYYISPEQVANEPPDPRMDVFSLGITLHELLVGWLPPHSGEIALGSFEDYRPVAADSLPAAMQEVLQRSFARRAADRYPTIQDFSREFRRAAFQSYPGLS